MKIELLESRHLLSVSAYEQDNDDVKNVNDHEPFEHTTSLHTLQLGNSPSENAYDHICPEASASSFLYELLVTAPITAVPLGLSVALLMDSMFMRNKNSELRIVQAAFICALHVIFAQLSVVAPQLTGSYTIFITE